MDEAIRISLHDSNTTSGGITIEINNQSTVQNLISSYCARKGIGYNSKIVVLDGKKNTLSQFRTLQSLGITNGQTLYIGYKKKSSVMDKKWVFVLTIITISVFVVAIIVMSSLYATSGGVVPFDFGIVIDGGSSKTNVLLYKWAGDKEQGTGCVRQEDECNKKIPISKATNFTYMLECIDNMKKHIKPSNLPITPLYFASTAGMRLLNISDPVKTQNILGNLTITLNDTGLSLKEVDIISGSDEGFYAWVTANFLKDTLEKPQQLDPWHPTTVGALDMGGASTQIAFALKPENITDPAVKKTTLYGQTHHVFSASYLCFGRDEAENRHRALLVNNPKTKAAVIDPCTPKGCTYNMTGKKLFDQPCTQSPKFKRWLDEDKQLKDKVFIFQGSSDFSSCSKNMTDLSNTASCKQMGFKECFTKINKPLKDQKFLAVATYYYTTSALGLNKATFDEYKEGMNSYCIKNIDEAKEMFKNDTNEWKYASTYCFNACYMYEILVNGYGFNNDTWRNLEFAGKIADKETGWSLGYMINATNMIPVKKPSPKFTTLGIFSVCIIIFLSVVIAGAVFLAYHFGQKNSDEASHNYFRNL